MTADHFDVLIIGAGLSGIGAAYHLQTNCPNKTYAILEARDNIGGTWDLFRYPGIRSDSDMYTLGYVFKPWTEKKAIANGATVLNYIKETASENGIDQHIKFNHKATQAAWSSETATWTISVEKKGAISCNFLFICSGYYDYDNGYTPNFVGMNNFKGQIVHPQKWNEHIDYKDKEIIVIGSGATAVTLVPTLAKTAKHVTMLQRSPTYIVSRPSEDKIATRFNKWLPSKIAYSLIRWKNALMGIYVYNIAQKKPQAVKKHLLDLVKKEMGPEYPVNTHFNPSYNPWDQRICMAPDSDLFNAIKAGTSTIVTDHIDRFTDQGILLKSGRELKADLIVTATGLTVQFAGGIKLVVDGKLMKNSKLISFKGMMLSNIPNLAGVVGYTNASWSLKCDLVCQHFCRLINYMDKNGKKQCTPRLKDSAVHTEPAIDLKSGYIFRAKDVLPQQGTEFPWKLHQNYVKDILLLKYKRVNDDALEFK